MNSEDKLCLDAHDKNAELSRTKLMMLALMSDKMNHHKDAIINTIKKLNIESLDEVEFDELWKNTNGHGGKDLDGHCSVYLEFINGARN